MSSGNATLGALYHIIEILAPVFGVALVTLYLLRVWCLITMRAQDPEFYEWLGRPELVPAYWGFFPSRLLRRAVADPAFGELTTSVRCTLQAALLCNLIASALFGAIILLMLGMGVVRFLH